MTALLEVSGVTKSFDGFRAINNLSFSIGAAELRAVIGPNGAGKTTFMDIVTGKTRPDRGQVLWGERSQSLLKMSEAQIHKFIFAPGFSTAAAVTSVSGRGVGMDVVRTNIDQIGGTIDVRSVAGQGVGFIIKIPLTLAIVAALIVEAGGERFAIPQYSVSELVRLRRGGDHRRRPVQDDAAVVEVHDAGVPAAVHVRARPRRPGPGRGCRR